MTYSPKPGDVVTEYGKRSNFYGAVPPELLGAYEEVVKAADYNCVRGKSERCNSCGSHTIVGVLQTMPAWREQGDALEAALAKVREIKEKM